MYAIRSYYARVLHRHEEASEIEKQLRREDDPGEPGGDVDLVRGESRGDEGDQAP